MIAHLLTVGDEILIGQIVNTNAAWMATELNLIGIHVAKMLTVGDEPAEIQAALEAGLAQADVILMTGGLGPTHDDLTKNAVSDFFNRPLQYHPDIFEHIRNMIEKRGRIVSDLNKVQAYVPAGFEVVPNPMGTAPGLWFETEWAGKTRYLGMMPGVPFEMKAIMQQTILPRLRALSHTAIAHKTLLTVGIGESNLAEQIGEVQAFLGEGASLAFLPGPKTGVKLRLTVKGKDQNAVEAELAKGAAYLWEKVGEHIYGEGEESPELVLGNLLKNKGLSIAVAESCTGGHLLDRLTDIPGASGYVLGGVIAYDNHVKINLLGVSEGDLRVEGAVSKAVACQMAEGVRRATGAAIGVSTTGIAGPDGGSEEKPVGTIWIGYADGTRTLAKKFILFKDRVLNKEYATTIALDLVRRILLKA